MRAKKVNEAFIELSDPIADMGIGGILFTDIRQQIVEDAIDNWYNVLRETLVGHTIRIVASKWGAQRHNDWQTYNIEVAEVREINDDVNTFNDIELKDTNGDIYTLLNSEKVYIIK